MKFGANSFLVLQFTEGYRREQQRKEEKENSGRKRKRRSLTSTQEEFSIRFRTRHDGLLLLASDSTAISVSGYTALEVNKIALCD